MRCLTTLLLCTTALALQLPAAAPGDRSGRYYLTLGHIPRYALELWENGAVATFTLQGPNLSTTGSGTVAGDTVQLAAAAGPGIDLSMTLVFPPTGQGFSGTWKLTGAVHAEGTLTGSLDPWPTYDLKALGVPTLVFSDCIQLWKIERISRFRSGEGHDFSDDFESCRSMKHYYLPFAGIEPGSVAVFSPVSGFVEGTLEEWEQALSKGTAMGIRLDTHPAFDVAIYHLRLARPFAVGDRVLAGQLLGTSAKLSGTATDVVVGVHTPAGYRLLSFFEVMSETAFAPYRARGVPTPRTLVIPRAERDADPLACEGERFLGPGTLPNWVQLSSPPPSHRLRRRLSTAPHPSPAPH